jgi:hypothetical protein
MGINGGFAAVEMASFRSNKQAEFEQQAQVE